MKAILIIPGQDSTPCPRVSCLALFPLLDRPFLQHVIEAIARRGIREIQIVHGPQAEAIVQFLGDGKRWGCTFSYQLIADPNQPELYFKTIEPSKSPILIGRADQLPALPTVLRMAGEGLLFGTPNNWLGWALVHSHQLNSIPPQTSLIAHLSATGAEWVDVGQSILLRTLADVATAQRTLMLMRFPGALFAAHETQPGIWIGRNVRLPEGVITEAPLFIGDNTVIADGVRVGPNAVVGANCLLARDSMVQETTVCSGTYVGVGVELNGVIVDERSLINPQRMTVITVDRRFLDRLAPGIPLTGVAALLTAGIVSICAVPVIAATYLWRKGIKRRLPPKSDSAEPPKPSTVGDQL